MPPIATKGILVIFLASIKSFFGALYFTFFVFDDLIKSYPKLLYVTETIGHGSNLVTGDYSVGASGFIIENGEFVYPVSEITIAGNFKDIFKNLTLANDLEYKYATNAPTTLVEGMTVAGK